MLSVSAGHGIVRRRRREMPPAPPIYLPSYCHEVSFIENESKNRMMLPVLCLRNTHTFDNHIDGLDIGRIHHRSGVGCKQQRKRSDQSADDLHFDQRV